MSRPLRKPRCLRTAQARIMRFRLPKAHRLVSPVRAGQEQGRLPASTPLGYRRSRDLPCLPPSIRKTSPEGERCHPNERHTFWGVNPGWKHFSEADAEKVKPCEGKGLLQHAVSPSWAHHAATIRVDLEAAWASPGSPALRTAVSRL